MNVDAWLREGGRVVASSDRAARAVLTAYHGARRAEGLRAWVAPAVESWQGFVREEWERRGGNGRLPLNAMQEELLWAEVIRQGGHGAALLDGPLRRLAGLAMEAHELLCGYAPRFLDGGARRGWQQDAEAFGGWLSDFDAECAANGAVSAARVAVELVSLLKGDAGGRAPLLLVGFDRVTPMQREVLEAWGTWRAAEPGAAAADVAYFAAANMQTELAACAAWCRRELEANPEARLLVVTQDAKARRGEMERAFLREAVRFEFSLGVPLGTMAIARCGHLLLRWLDGASGNGLAEHEVDWLLSTEYIGSAQEAAALRAFHRGVRRKGLQRTEWTLEAWLGMGGLPEAWSRRMVEARRLLREGTKGRLAPLEWCALTPRLLEAAGWPGTRALSSAEFQALRRWEQAVDACGSLGFDGRRMEWRQFVTELGRALQATLFAAESEDAPVLIAGPAESAGIAADGIWFLGADEDAWPGRGSMNPLIPAEVQKAAKMPHAEAQVDAELARAITVRLLGSAGSGSAGKVRFSYARLKDDVEARASRMVAQLTNEVRKLPEDMIARGNEKPKLDEIVGASRIAMPVTDASDDVHGGAAVLTAQSQCPFQAFATARLEARKWDAAEAGLTAAERGNLVHEVMHAVWGGKATGGITTLGELLALTDRAGFVAGHVDVVMREKVPASVRERMPKRYLELESLRLKRLVGEWLEYEAMRLPFTVLVTEDKRPVLVGGMRLRLQLDRVDQLNDGMFMVIDYKTSDVKPKMWELPRPEDVQLPLYAGFALPKLSGLGGLAFAKVRAGEAAFAGCVRDAGKTIRADLKANSGLMTNKLTDDKLAKWRDAIEQLARDFLAGKADVDPCDYPKTCERCGLQAVCRVLEQHAAVSEEDDEEAAYDAG